MSDEIRIDSHKLIYHPKSVADWLNGNRVYPLEIEVGLSGACNHRCTFCAIDYMEYKPVFMDSEILLTNISQMAQRGLKSVVCASNGEPLLNKNAPYIFTRIKSLGVDVALSTNGVLMTKEKAEAFLAAMTWIRFSVSAATSATYNKIHRGGGDDLEKVFTNLQDAVKIKRNKHLDTTLGAQMLLLEENKNEVVALAKIMREIGIDYITVKPFMQNPQSKIKRQVDYSESGEIEKEVKELATADFAVYFRRQAVENVSREKEYDKCYAAMFMAHIDAQGDVFPCCAFLDDKNLSYGNIYERSFVDIWESDRTNRIMESLKGALLHTRCYKGCRLEEMNKYLYNLKNPHPHVNFI